MHDTVRLLNMALIVWGLLLLLWLCFSILTFPLEYL